MAYKRRILTTGRKTTLRRIYGDVLVLGKEGDIDRDRKVYDADVDVDKYEIVEPIHAVSLL